MKKNGILKIAVGRLVGIVGIGVSVCSWALAAPRSDELLQQKVRESFSRLSDLEPWQRKLLGEEILPQYKRFVKRYSEGAGRVDAEIDVELIRSQLTFYGPHFFSVREPQVHTWVVSIPGCEKCTEAQSKVMQVWKTRSARRGLISIWMKSPLPQIDPEVEEDSPEENWEKKLLEQTKKVGANAALLVILSPHPDHEGDHLLKVLWVSLDKKRPFRKAITVEVLGSDLFEKIFDLQVSGLFQELGDPRTFAAHVQSAASPLLPHEGVRVEVAGIKSYEHFLKIKEYLSGVVGDSGTCVERKLIRGVAQFVLFSKAPREQWVEKLSAGTSKGTNLGVRLEKSKEPMILDSDLRLEVR